MSTIIKIELNNKFDLYETYNHQQISQALINYLLTECSHGHKPYQIRIYDYIGLPQDIIIFLKKALQLEYQYRKNQYQDTNIKQVWLLTLGIILLLLSITISNYFLFKEIILIAGWVVIWETVDIQLFSDITERRKIKQLHNLINSDYLVIKKIYNPIYFLILINICTTSHFVFPILRM